MSGAFTNSLLIWLKKWHWDRKTASRGGVHSLFDEMKYRASWKGSGKPFTMWAKQMPVIYNLMTSVVYDFVREICCKITQGWLWLTSFPTIQKCQRWCTCEYQPVWTTSESAIACDWRKVKWHSRETGLTEEWVLAPSLLLRPAVTTAPSANGRPRL